MIPVIHARGRSFVGLTKYLLGPDPGAEVSKRVAWTETVNLITDRPRQAARVMAACAMDAARLKRKAGGSAAGVKSGTVVLHLSLGWAEHEKDGLTREEMMRAALGALRVLGAEDRQALVVAHKGTNQHVHLMVNRVSQTDGKLLPTWKEKIALSKFAEEYERSRGEILCPRRVVANAARSRGEFTRGKKRRPRKLYEAERAGRNRPDADEVRSQQRGKDAAVARRARELAQRHQAARQQQAHSHRDRVKSIRAESRRSITVAVDAVRTRFAPQWEGMFHEHQAAIRDFRKRETEVLGRVQNAFRAIDFSAIVRAGDRKQAITRVFQALCSSGARERILRRRHAREEAELAARQRREEVAAAAVIRGQREAALRENRQRYRQERGDLLLIQRLERAALRADWKTRDADREKAWDLGARGVGDRGTGELSRSRAASLIESVRAQMRRRATQRGNEQDNDRDRGRER